MTSELDLGWRTDDALGQPAAPNWAGRSRGRAPVMARRAVYDRARQPLSLHSLHFIHPLHTLWLVAATRSSGEVGAGTLCTIACGVFTLTVGCSFRSGPPRSIFLSLR